MVSLGSIKVSAEEANDISIIENGTEMAEERIDRFVSGYVMGGGTWTNLPGDNNLFGETVQVTNCSNATIKVKAFNAYGTQIGSTQTLTASGAGNTTTFYFPHDSGTYSFKAQFEDQSAGWITVYLLTL